MQEGPDPLTCEFVGKSYFSSGFLPSNALSPYIGFRVDPSGSAVNEVVNYAGANADKGRAHHTYGEGLRWS
jgi:hypothetical protein